MRALTCFIAVVFVALFLIDAGCSSAKISEEERSEAAQLFQLAVLASVSGRSSEERRHLEEALSRDPDHLGAWKRLGRLLKTREAQLQVELQQQQQQRPNDLHLIEVLDQIDKNTASSLLLRTTSIFQASSETLLELWPTEVHQLSSADLPSNLLGVSTLLREHDSSPRYCKQLFASPPMEFAAEWCALALDPGLAVHSSVTVHFPDPRATALMTADSSHSLLSGSRQSIVLSSGRLLLFPSYLQFYLLAADSQPLLVTGLSSDQRSAVLTRAAQQSDVQSLRLWPTPVLRRKFDVDQLNHQLWQDVSFIERVDQPTTVTKSNRGNAYQTRADLFQRYANTHLASLDQLRHQIIAHSLQAFLNHSSALAFTRAPSTLTVHQSWAAVSRRGAENVVHVHPDSLVSGVYYVRGFDDDQTGQLCLLDPRQLRRPEASSSPSSSDVRFCLRPEQGLLLLFPSWLEHYVTPHQSDHERVVIAFNAREEEDR